MALPSALNSGAQMQFFVGQAVHIEPLKNKPDDVYDYVMVRFRIEESFRGVSGPMVAIGTATTMCDTKFKKGKRYLVYASFDQPTNGWRTKYKTHTSKSCGRQEL